MSDAHLTIGAAIICLGSMCIGFVLAAASLLANRDTDQEAQDAVHGSRAGQDATD